MLPAKKRGLTTQNTAPSVSSGATCAFVEMVTRTRALSGDSLRLFTVPNSMSLNLSGDLPACKPSALSNETSIVGPSFDKVSQTSQPAIATASKGINQITESRCDRRVVACGGAGDMLAMSMTLPSWSNSLGSALAGNPASACPASSLATIWTDLYCAFDGSER